MGQVLDLVQIPDVLLLSWYLWGTDFPKVPEPGFCPLPSSSLWEALLKPRYKETTSPRTEQPLENLFNLNFPVKFMGRRKQLWNQEMTPSREAVRNKVRFLPGSWGFFSQWEKGRPSSQRNTLAGYLVATMEPALSYDQDSVFEQQHSLPS